MEKILEKINELTPEQIQDMQVFITTINNCSNEELIEHYKINLYQCCADLSFYRPIYIKSDIINLEGMKRLIDLSKHQFSLEEAMNAEDNF